MKSFVRNIIFVLIYVLAIQGFTFGQATKSSCTHKNIEKKANLGIDTLKHEENIDRSKSSSNVNNRKPEPVKTVSSNHEVNRYDLLEAVEYNQPVAENQNISDAEKLLQLKEMRKKAKQNGSPTEKYDNAIKELKRKIKK